MVPFAGQKLIDPQWVLLKHTHAPDGDGRYFFNQELKSSKGKKQTNKQKYDMACKSKTSARHKRYVLKKKVVLVEKELKA